MLPFALVERQGFIDYNYSMDPYFRVPTRKSLTIKLSECKLEIESKIRTLFETATTVNTSVDGWSDETMRCFNGYVAQFIDKDWNMHTVSFAFEYVTGQHTGANIKAQYIQYNTQAQYTANQTTERKG